MQNTPFVGGKGNICYDFRWSLNLMNGFGIGISFLYFTMQVDECIFWLSMIFITIMCTPQPTIVRWSSTPPVSDEVRLQWKGFCAIIANAYFMRGMAWCVTFWHISFPFLVAQILSSILVLLYLGRELPKMDEALASVNEIL